MATFDNSSDIERPGAPHTVGSAVSPAGSQSDALESANSRSGSAGDGTRGNADGRAPSRGDGGNTVSGSARADLRSICIEEKIKWAIRSCNERLSIIESAVNKEVRNPIWQRRTMLLTFLYKEREVYSFALARLEDLLRGLPCDDEGSE